MQRNKWKKFKFMCAYCHPAYTFMAEVKTEIIHANSKEFYLKQRRITAPVKCPQCGNFLKIPDKYKDHAEKLTNAIPGISV